jgi:hypothetical protein
VESEGDEFPVADVRIMKIRMFNELKEELTEDLKNNSMNPKRAQIKKKQKPRNNYLNSERI